MTTEPREHINTAALIELLDVSTPSTPVTDATSDRSLHEMARSTGEQTRRTVFRRLTPRAIAIGTVLALTLGGAGAAAAAGLSRWQPWAENPDATVHFTLPSGAACEYRIVANDTGDPADFRTAEDFLRSTDVLAAADIDDELARISGNDVTVRADDGDISVPATTLYSKDELYRQAVTGAITNAIWDAMDQKDITDPTTGTELSFSSQSDCVGVAP